MKVSLLDVNKRDLPGRNFYYSGQVPHLNAEASPLSGEWIWDCLGHVFSSYPPGLRFVRFEDTMQSGTSFPRPFLPPVGGGMPRDPWKQVMRSDGLEGTVQSGGSFSGVRGKIDPSEGLIPSDGYDVRAFRATVEISQR